MPSVVVVVNDDDAAVIVCCFVEMSLDRIGTPWRRNTSSIRLVTD